MKRINSILIFFCLSVILLSCGGNSKFSPEIIPVLVGEKWGYIDLEGKYVINPQFDDANYFVGEIALVKSSNKYGYITQDGKYLVNAQYKEASNFSEGLAAVVQENGKIKYIDESGKTKFELTDTEFAGDFHNGMAKVQMGDKWGFVDKSGKVIVTATYDEVGDFVDDFASFKQITEGDESREERWGFLDKSGKIAINAQFISSSNFSDGLAKVSIDGERFGFIDTKGKYVINPQFEDASDFSNDLAAIKQGDSWGLIDKEGKITVNPQFESISLPMSNGLIAVESNGKWGYIDKDGKYVINPQFDFATSFIGKVAIIMSAKKIGLIDKEGKYIVNPQFDDTKRIGDLSLYGEGYNFNVVQSDYFDANGVISSLFKNNQFLGLTPEKSAVKDIAKLFNLKQSDFSFKSVSIYKDEELNKLFGNKFANIQRVEVEFENETYSYNETYKYRTDYWGAQVKYSAGREKVFNDTSKVSAMSLKIGLMSKAVSKGEAIANSLKKKIVEIYKLEDLKSERENTIFLKSKNNMKLFVIAYSESHIEVGFISGKASEQTVNSLMGKSNYDEYDQTEMNEYEEAELGDVVDYDDY